MIVQAAHFGISAVELEKSIAWYGEMFGFKEKKRFEKPELKIKGALLQNGQCFIEILQPDNPDNPSPPGPGLPAHLARTGSNHIALGVADVKATFDFLLSRKVEMVTNLIDGKFFFCKDPDNSLIEIKGLS